MADIFLSYAREDLVRARQLAEALEARGWSVWWDRRITHGADFQAVIQAQLDEAKCIVVLWSKSAVTSKFVRDEAREGSGEDGQPARLVPVLIESVKPPLGFRGMHNANLVDWRAQPSHEEFGRLVESIATLVPLRRATEASAVDQPAIAPTQPPSVQSQHRPDVPTVPREVQPAAVLRPSATPARAAGPTLATAPPSPAAAPAGPKLTEQVERSGEPSAGSESGEHSWAPELSTLFSNGEERAGVLPRIQRFFFDHRRGVLSVVVTLGVAFMAVAIWPSSPGSGSIELGSTGSENSSGSATSPPDSRTPPAGPPRFNAQLWNLPDEPLLGLVEIGAGDFLMGSDKAEDPQAYDDELPQHLVNLPAYFIGRYEVTVGQYKSCVGDGGCAPADKQAVEGPENHPVRFVSWGEALAYCRWLEAKLRSSSQTPQPVADALAGRRGSPWHVTLPSEAEWEKAARGTDVRIYPWGALIDGTRANYGDPTGGTTAVGSYPSGASPYGLLDISGNVWEWTRSLWGPDGGAPQFKYPYEPRDGREELGAKDVVARVVRGGSSAMAGSSVPPSASGTARTIAATIWGFVWWCPHSRRPAPERPVERHVGDHHNGLGSVLCSLWTLVRRDKPAKCRE